MAEVYFSHLAPVLLISARLSGLIAFAPVFDSTAVPARIKLALVLVLSLVFHLGFGLGQGYALDLSAVWPLAAGLLLEFAAGVAMGLTLILVFSSFAFAGALIAPQMGLAVSQLIDPQTQSMQPLLSTFLGLTATLFFLAIDGHLLMLRAFYESYAVLPMAGLVPGGGLVEGLLAAGGELFVISFKLAAPVLAVIVFLNVGMAILARAVPQVNVIVVGFIVTITVGFLTLYFVLPQLGPVLRGMMEAAVERMLWILKTA